MKNIKKLFAPLCIIILSTTVSAMASSPGDFEKYELVSTMERSIAGVDADGLVVYGKNGELVTAYDIITDSPLFELGENQETVAPFYFDGTAVITGKEGYAGGIVAKDGTLLAQLPEGYIYSGEYGCGFIRLIDKNAEENVYTITDRMGNILAEHFFAPECELENKNIIIGDAGGGHTMIKPDGSVTSFPCRETVRIEDAVSICTGVYVGTDGNLYSEDNKILYENRGFYRISPVNENFLLGVKKGDGKSEKYIIDIKDKKETIIEESDIFGDYIYSEGHVCDSKTFIGNSENSVLVNLKNGKVLSSQVEDYSCFYNHISTVKLSSDETAYRFIKCDGSYLNGEYIYASDFAGGYAVAVEKTNAGAVVYMVNTDGKRYELYIASEPEKVEISENLFVKLTVSNDNNTQNIVVRKTASGNIYIGNDTRESYVYVPKETTSSFKAVAAIIAITAIAIIATSVGYTARRKRVKTDDTSK